MKMLSATLSAPLNLDQAYYILVETEAEAEAVRAWGNDPATTTHPEEVDAVKTPGLYRWTQYHGTAGGFERIATAEEWDTLRTL